MITEDRDIPVNYYLIQSGSPLEKEVREYLDACQHFVGQAEGLVKKYNAVSAARLVDFWDTRVHGLNFMLQDAPPSWRMDGFGHFRPVRPQESKDFDFQLPSMVFACPSSRIKVTVENTTGQSLVPSAETMKIGHLGHSIVVSAPKNSDGTPYQSDALILLSDTDLDALKSCATADQLEHFKSLSRRYSDPLPFSLTNAFTSTQQVSEQNQRIFREIVENAGEVPWKYTPIGRRVSGLFEKYFG